MAVATLKMLGGMDQLPGGLATDNTNFDATSFNGDYRIDDIDEQIRELYSQEATFYRMLSLFRRGKPAQNPAYRWVRSDVPAVSSRVTTGVNASATTIYVADSTVFQPGCLVLCPRTQEIMTVVRGTAFSSLVTFTVTGGRGSNGTTAAALVAGDELQNLGTPLAERGVATNANAQLPVFMFNYVSFFTTKVGVTELQENTRMRYNIDFPKQVRDEWFKLQRQVNNHILWSRRSYTDDATYGRYYFTDGFMHQIQSNVVDLSRSGGILTWPMWNNIMHNMGEPTASSPRKVLVCGANLFEAMQVISYNRTQKVEYETALGTQVSRINTTQGLTVDIVLDRWSFPGDLAGWGIVVDLDHVELKEMGGFPFQVRQNIQDNNVHYREDEIFGSASVQVDHEEVHGIIKGVEGAY